MEQYLNVIELATLLRVRPGTVYSWISRKVDVPHVKLGGSIRFRPEAVEKWLLEKETERLRRNFEL